MLFWFFLYISVNCDAPKRRNRSCEMIIDDQDKCKNLVHTASVSPLVQELFDFAPAWWNLRTASKLVSNHWNFHCREEGCPNECSKTVYIPNSQFVVSSSLLATFGPKANFGIFQDNPLLIYVHINISVFALCCRAQLRAFVWWFATSRAL